MHTSIIRVLNPQPPSATGLPTLTVLSLIIFLILGSAFVFPSNIMYSFYSGPRLFFFLCIAALLIISATQALFEKKQLDAFGVRINQIDIILFLSIFYVFIKPGSTSLAQFYNTWNICQICITVLYFVLKFFLARIVMWKVFGIQMMMVISVTLSLSVGYGVLQLFDILPNYNYYFTITGHFQNPARYAGFIVSLTPFIAATFLYFPKRNRNLGIIHYFSLSILIGCIIIILISGSRAALVAIISTVLALVYFKHKHWFLEIVSVRYIFGLVCAGFSGLLYFLYQVNTSSVEARFFIWKTSLAIINNFPFFGIGGGNFESVYNNYQAIFYEQGKMSEAQMRHADLISYPYNIFLQFICEQGIIGLSLFLVLIFCIATQFRSIEEFDDYKKWLKMSSLAGIFAIIVFGLFSYPFDIIPVLALFYIYVAILSSLGPGMFIDIKKIRQIWIKLGLVLCLFVSGILLFNYTKRQYNAYYKWMNMERLEVKSFQPLYPELGDQSRFLLSYSNILLKEKKFDTVIGILGGSDQFLAYPELQINLAESYGQIGDSKRAEYHFERACLMVPNRLNPKFTLFNYYCSQMNYDKAEELALVILKAPVRVHTQRTDEIRSKVRDALIMIHRECNCKKVK